MHLPGHRIRSEQPRVGLAHRGPPPPASVWPQCHDRTAVRHPVPPLMSGGSDFTDPAEITRG
ncbi:hypothetical protein SNL152K_10046 [Streptomyces sp. NL15-2K]|nr:hypothetical protein SNL152K_10046 [Streptomyces sp. NL15-2K]